jgi:hypothetical protein
MNKKIILATVIAITAISSLFMSCDNEAPTSSIELNITSYENTNKDLQRTIIPTGVPLEIVEYKVVIMDENLNNLFEDTINCNKCTIADLPLGFLYISIQGKNTDGTIIAQGATEMQLTALPSAINVELTQCSGLGGIELNFTWNPDCIKDPTLEAELTHPNGDVERITPQNAIYNEGKATYNFQKQKAGSYTIAVRLLDGNTNVAGCVEAIRVIDKKVSAKTIHLNISTTSDVSEKKNSPLIITDKTGTPLSCIITNVDSNIAYNSTIRPILVAKDSTPLTDYNITWYIDGIVIGSGNNCAYKPTLGKHRLDVVVENKEMQASKSSCNFIFECSSNTPYFVPTLVNTIKNKTDDVNVGRGMDLCFLPDGKLLLYCGEYETLQICRIVNDSLEVIKTYKNSITMPLTRVNDIKACYKNNKVFVSEDATNTITAYDYSYNQLTPIYGDNTYNNKATKLGNITIRAYDIFVDDPNSCAFRQYLLNPQTDEEQQEFSVSYAYNSRMGNFNCHTASISPDLRGILRTSTNGYTSFANLIKGVEDLSIIPYSLIGPTFPINEEINGAALTYNKFIIGSMNKLTYYTVPSFNTMGYELKTTIEGGENKISNFKSVADFAFFTNLSKIDASNIVDKLYVVTKNSNTILTFEVNENDFKLTLLGKVDLATFIPKEAAISPNQENMIIVSSTGNTLKLLKIRNQ